MGSMIDLGRQWIPKNIDFLSDVGKMRTSKGEHAGADMEFSILKIRQLAMTHPKTWSNAGSYHTRLNGRD